MGGAGMKRSRRLDVLYRAAYCEGIRSGEGLAVWQKLVSRTGEKPER
jgi:hypothetical protein